MRNVVRVSIALVFLPLGGCFEPPRPSKTQIAQADYVECKTNFEACKGKFIKFEGFVERKGSTYLRIVNDVHGFDVFGLWTVDEKYVGSKVVFSGYVKEKHKYHDDIVWGRIDAVLMNPREALAERNDQVEQKKNRDNKIAAEKKAYEDAHPTCETNWKVCSNNADLINKSKKVMFKVELECQMAANEAARYGKPQWSWTPFGRFLPGDSYPKTGIVTVIDQDVKFQNAFGTYGKSRVVCAYDLNKDKVVNVAVD